MRVCHFIVRSNKGFSLMEIIIGIALMGILLIAFISLFSGSMYFSIMAGDRSEAATDTAGIIENVLSESIDDAANIVEVDGESYPVSKPDVTVVFNQDTSKSITFQCQKIVVTTTVEMVKGDDKTTVIEVFKCE